MPDDNIPSQKYRDFGIVRYFVTELVINNFSRNNKNSKKDKDMDIVQTRQATARLNLYLYVWHDNTNELNIPGETKKIPPYDLHVLAARDGVGWCVLGRQGQAALRQRQGESERRLLHLHVCILIWPPTNRFLSEPPTNRHQYLVQYICN